MDSDVLLALWGKTDRKNPENYHPLLFHLYDVLYCALELWDRLPASLRNRLAGALNVSEREARTFCAFLAGLHDLGKGCPNFQQKAEPFLPALKQIGFDFPTISRPQPHNFVSVPEVMRLLQSDHPFPLTLGKDDARLCAYALGAHHGIFPKAGDVSERAITSNTLGENALWREYREELALRLFQELYAASSPPQVRLAAPLDRALAPLLAGFISVADWFGSSKHFPLQGKQEELDPYPQRSKAFAQTALTASGWTMPPGQPERADFPALFAYLQPEGLVEPNALQKKTLALLEDAPTPALWIIEEEMGAGKTEAAFAIFDHARVMGQSHGLYIAMPTQATSNAMHTRLTDFLHKGRQETNINLILAHSHAVLDANYRERIERAEQFQAQVYDEQENGETGALRIQEWFTHHKQTLLTHYGVGTIDQALFGVLQTRHWFVRLFGLTGKVVIFDEVHAYDAYMNTLLQRLIGWLSELDCTVVLLSATLPRKTRHALADAYREGAWSELKTQADFPEYPRITLVGKREAARAIPIEKTEAEKAARQREVTLEHLPNQAECVKTALLEAIPGNGCAIVVCNTVRGAQAMYQELRALLQPEGWDCWLFHARMPFCWRKKREEKVLELFGKDSGGKRTKPREKTLLVATQVVEQSLDLDADFMVSELAPIDLILQRMGRLWRHERKRTAAAPRFALLYDTAENGLPDISRWEKIYTPHTLLRSWLELRARAEIVLPDEIEPLVSAVYDADDPMGLPQGWESTLREWGMKADEEARQRSQMAENVSVPEHKVEGGFLDWLVNMGPTLLDEENPEVHQTLRAVTRDGDPSITVICCGSDADGQLLAPNPTGRITPDQVIEMMSFSLPISDKSLYFTLIDEPQPENWKKNAHLKYCRQIIFERGQASVNNVQLNLSRERGLEIG